MSTVFSSNLTRIWFANRLTVTSETPLSFFTLRVTFASHAAHVMPVTLNFSVLISPSPLFELLHQFHRFIHDRKVTVLHAFHDAGFHVVL